MAMNSFGVLDIIVFGLTLCVSLTIGIVFAVCDKRKKRNTPDHYFLGDRKAKIVPVMLSFVVTFQSSILLLGFPAEGYTYGIALSLYGIGYLFCVVIVALFVVPVFYPLKLTSVYEYFKLRYGSRYLLYLTLTFGVLYSLFYMGTVTYGTSIALEVVMGIPRWATILLYLFATTLYTSIGGINAVIWTDVFQSIIMILGIVSIITKGILDAGGSGKVYELAQDRFEAIDFSLDPRLRYTFWNVSFGSITMYLILCFMQPAMQRVYAMPSVRAARNMYFFTIPLFSLLLVLCSMEGPVLLAYFTSKGCDIVESKIVDVNGIVPFAVLEMFQNIPGLRGLFIAALSSAALSTLSSCLSGLAALTYIDVIKVRYPNLSPERATQVSKITVVFFGVVAVGVSFMVSAMPGSVTALFQTFMSCLDGPTSAIFLLSIFCRRVTSKGLIIGAIVGASFPIWINLGRMFSDIPSDPTLPSGTTEQCWKYQGNATDHVSFMNNTTTTMMYSTNVTAANVDAVERSLSGIEEFYSISYVWLSFIGFAVTTVVSLSISFVTKAPDYIDERCLFSFEKHFRAELFGKKEKKHGNSNKLSSINGVDKKESIPLM